MKSRLQILGGELKGRRLEVAAGVRPTESRVREALFSIWRPRLPVSRFLDLFAGSGAVGLEAASLGAAEVWFADCRPRVLAALRRNAAVLETEPVAPEGMRILHWRLPENRDLGRRFDLIFADPPYEFDRYGNLLRVVAPWLTATGELAIEHSTRRQLTAAEPWEQSVRRYGESCLSFFRRGE